MQKKNGIIVLLGAVFLIGGIWFFTRAKTPDYSVVMIANLRDAGTLTAAIDSILAQPDSLELFVAVNEPTEQMNTVLKAYAKHSNVFVIRSEPAKTDAELLRVVEPLVEGQIIQTTGHDIWPANYLSETF